MKASHDFHVVFFRPDDCFVNFTVVDFILKFSFEDSQHTHELPEWNFKSVFDVWIMVWTGGLIVVPGPGLAIFHRFVLIRVRFYVLT